MFKMKFYFSFAKKKTILDLDISINTERTDVSIFSFINHKRNVVINDCVLYVWPDFCDVFTGVPVC